jgi:diguanylate cyclase (GGDEF)-like protein
MPQHVVIVDDQQLNLKLFTSIANEVSDVAVHPFTSSLEALAWCAGKEVDCFILDYHMPAPDGLEMIARLRASDAFAMVPIVIVTGEHEREVRYRAFDAGANDFLQKPVDYREFVARLTTLLALRSAQKRLGMQIESLEASLLDSEERSRYHAERLEALWRIANNPTLQDEELVYAMLEQGAAAIRPGQPFLGLLGRIEGPELVTEALAGDGGELSRKLLRVGNRTGVDRTVVAHTLASGGTQSWDDWEERDVATKQRSLGWRAVISTHFTAGGATYALTFASAETTLKSFGPQDHAYVEVLAAFFSTHLQQQWQALRIRHQLEHDSLTGLRNRSRFRSMGRAAFDPGRPFAVAVVDLVRFHELNEAHGHLIGDAVLVEVAAALAAEARDDETVARVGGDSFAIFFPTVPSRAALMDRIARYTAVFDVPMGIGDREGKESVPAEGAIGVALAPADGATFDELFFRAESRAGAAALRPDRLLFPVSG